MNGRSFNIAAGVMLALAFAWWVFIAWAIYRVVMWVTR